MRIGKVVILAGGLGSRLSEETEIRPKPLVEIGDRPILWHIMAIYSKFGLRDFVVCLGYKRLYDQRILRELPVAYERRDDRLIDQFDDYSSTSS